MRNAYKILVGLFEGKRALEGPKKTTLFKLVPRETG
jgi:hypothetical protein